MTRFPDRVFAFDQFGPLSIRPCHGACWARKKHPDRLPATYHRYHGTRYFHGCYDLANDRLWGVLHEHKGGRHTLKALKSIRAARPDGAPIYIVCDNLSCNTTPAIRTWAAAHKVELCLTPTNASWADPIEAQFGPLRMFTMANSDYPNHIVLARDLHAYLRWRNANARHPDVLAAQRRERARVRSEHHRRWGRPQPDPLETAGHGILCLLARPLTCTFVTQQRIDVGDMSHPPLEFFHRLSRLRFRQRPAGTRRRCAPAARPSARDGNTWRWRWTR